MWKKLLGFFSALMLVLPSLAFAEGASVHLRPLEDFLAAQGTTTQFVPPVDDYVGWVDRDVITFALIDYAGLANEFVETESGGAISLQTKTSGSVFEREAADGRAVVRIRLVTQNALGWAFLVADADFVNDPFPFLNTPLSFGARAQDVLLGAEPALGISAFNLRFMNTAPGAPLPDLVQLLNDPQPEQVPLRFSFRAFVPSSSPDGTLSLLDVRQRCRGELDNQGEAVLVCDREVVDIRSFGDAE